MLKPFYPFNVRSGLGLGELFHYLHGFCIIERHLLLIVI